MKLMAARYNHDGDTLHEVFTEPANIGVRWSLPGGVQRIEVTIAAESEALAFDRYRYNLGDRLVLYDTFADRPVAEGWIMAAPLRGNRYITYVAAGAWHRHGAEHEDTAPASAATTGGAYLVNEVLANHILGGNLDTTNINTSTTTVMGEWKPDAEIGTRVDDIIKQIVKQGTSVDNEVLDYWLEPNDFDGPLAQWPKAHLAVRSNTALDWQVNRRDIRNLEMTRDLWQLANTVRVAYSPTTTLSAGANGGGTAITVASTAALNVGDEIEIYIDNTDRWYVTTIDTLPGGGTVTLVDRIPGTATPEAASGNTVRRIKPLEPYNLTDATSVSSYWTAMRREIQRDMDATQAEQWARVLRAELAYPMLGNAFAIGSRWIMDGYGQRWPLWRMLQSPGVLRVNDLFPSADVFDDTLDALRSMRVAALDYDHSARVMRVEPDYLDYQRRTDTVLEQIRLETGLPLGVGQIVGRMA